MEKRGAYRVSRRSMLKLAAGAGTAAALGALGARGATWAADRPIVIGHQCDLTGALASSGYWRDKAARAAIDRINKDGGVAGRPIKYVVEDTETNPSVGVRKLRKLIQEDGSDFVIGSEHGGLGIASAPVVKETKTLYSSISYTDAITGKAGNRYIIRLTNTTLHGATAAAGWAVSRLGKTWSVIYSDYAYGHAHRDNWTSEVEKAGGRVLAKIGIPVGTQDPMAYLVNVASGSDAVYVAVLGPDQPRCLTALQQIGFKGNRILGTTLMEAFDPSELQQVTEGLWGTGMLPLELAFRDTPHLRAMRDALAIDPNGRERNTGTLAVMSDVWSPWESVTLLKLAVEKSGWKEKKDTPKVIEFLESVERLPEGRDFPQGDLLFRAQDHQAFMDFYVYRVEGKRIRTIERIPKERGIYPAVVDYRKEPL